MANFAFFKMSWIEAVTISSVVEKDFFRTPQLVDWSLPNQRSAVRIPSSQNLYIEHLMSAVLKRRK